MMCNYREHQLYFVYRKTLVMKNTGIFLFIIFLGFSCKSPQQIKNNPKLTNSKEFSFTKAVDDIKLEKRSRRKFDNAVIADLDQDGWLDLLLTEHSRRVEVYWNNFGVYEKGKPFIFGDTHGISVADYNRDRLMDVLVQPGGGDGKNPRRLRTYSIGLNRKIVKKEEFKNFKASRGRAVKLIDTYKNGELNVLLTAFPPRDKINKAHFYYKKNQQGAYQFGKFLPYADRFNMRSTITDYNNDNVKDFLFYGGEKVLLVKGEKGEEFKDVSTNVLGDLSNTNLVNSISEIDFDNDGDFDLFLTRSKHPFVSESDYDTMTKKYYFFDRRRAFQHEIEVQGDLVLENLQMAFPHFDINIGKNKKLYKRTLDRHGEQNLTITQKEAKGFPKNTSKRGLYIGYLGNNIWRISCDTDSPTSAVIHNVSKAPKTIPLKNLEVKLLENKNGKFIDVTKKLGILVNEQTTSSAIGDFNNDGWQDIFIVRYGKSASVIEQFLLKNIEGKTFKKIKNHGIIRSETGAVGMGADTFDYDKDGDLDIIYANERGRWNLFKNNLNNSNNYITINVGKSPKNKASAMGAVVTLKLNDLILKRVVGATSASYSQSFNTFLHFGLGTNTTIDEVSVLWSNGQVLKLNIDKVNKLYTTD